MMAVVMNVFFISPVHTDPLPNRKREESNFFTDRESLEYCDCKNDQNNH